MNISRWWFDSQRALFFFGVPFFCHLFLFGAVWILNRVPLEPDTLSIILLYDI